MIPEVIITMLACARIGAPHSVVFSAFSGESLRDRLQDAEVKVLVTADGYYRRGRPINLKANADIGVKDTKVKHVVVVKRTGIDITTDKKRDKWWHELMEDASADCPAEPMDSEDPLFILYTSGSTGKPKVKEVVMCRFFHTTRMATAESTRRSMRPCSVSFLPVISTFS